MKRCSLLTLAFLAFTIQAKSRQAKTEHILRQLDQVVALDSVYTSLKLAEIQRLKNNLELAILPTDKYLSFKQISNAYSHFCSDSALVYYRRCYEFGEENANQVWMQDAAIHQSFILADRGDNYLAFDRLHRLGEFRQIHAELQPLYAEAMMMGYVRVTTDSFKKFSNMKAGEAWSVYGKLVPADSPYYYLYYMVANPDYDAGEVAGKIKDQLKSTPEASKQDAMLRMTLALCYQKEDRRLDAIEQLALSAMSDIKCSNKNSSSLTMLLTELNGLDDASGQLSRLLRYAEVSSDNASMYNDVGRSIRLVKGQKQILKKYGRKQMPSVVTRFY